MELFGNCIMPVPPAAVWHALNDPAVMARCIPGCEEINKVSEHETVAKVVVKLGPVRARFSGKVTMSDVVPGSSCTLRFEGNGGAAGFAKGSSRITLAAVETGTHLGYSAEASVGGKLGQIGSRMIDSAAKGLADQFFAALAKEWEPIEAQTPQVESALQQVDKDASVPPTPEVTSAPPILDPEVIRGASSASDASVTRSAGRTSDRVERRDAGSTGIARGEAVRVLWFLMGAVSTVSGIFVARWI